MQSISWPYLAGIFDGEGTVNVILKKENPRWTAIQIWIYGTSLNLMKSLVKSFGGRYYLRPKTRWSQLPQYQWRPSGKKNRENLILGMLPYAIIKREQLKLAIEFERLPYGSCSRRLEIKNRISALNQGSESVTTNTPRSEDFEMRESGLTSNCESVVPVMAAA